MTRKRWSWKDKCFS